ncbi:MAG: ABC transporter ATP-binding protein [Gammaproteobacteria bacterium]|nr:ABC transporter ATP-binding protein [Gammaproteobacteria bacterium]
MPDAIAVKSLSRRFGDRQVLADVSFVVTQGAACALVGANGAGKTTLIKILLDFLNPSAGDVQLFGRAPGDPGSRAGSAFLPERFIPPAFLTGNEFLRYTAELQGTALNPDAVLAMAARLDLGELDLSKSVGAYSKGMAQKLGLLACLMASPKLLLLDEPMSGLDVQGRRAIKLALQEYHAAGGTLLFTSHLLNDISGLADDLVVLDQGRVRFNGAPADFLAAHGAADMEQAYLACVAGQL